MLSKLAARKTTKDAQEKIRSWRQSLKERRLKDLQKWNCTTDRPTKNLKFLGRPPLKQFT